MARVDLTVNGQVHNVDVDAERPLLGVLRDDLGLYGTKYGCGEAQCGACTVWLDGRPVRSCVTRVGGAAGRAVTTIEGIGDEESLHPLQQAFLEQGALQCGYCTPGMIMAAAALLEREPEPTDADIRAGHGRQRLPLRCLPPHHRSRPPGGQRDPRVSRITRNGRHPDQERIVMPDPESHRSNRRPERATSGSTDPVRRAGVRSPPPSRSGPSAHGSGPDEIESDRYELFAPPAYRFDLHRRDFLRIMGGGVAVAVLARDLAALAPLDRGRPGARSDAADEEVGAWLHIGPYGDITVFTGKVEVGQDIRTSLTQAVADELRVASAQVSLVMGDTDLTPFDMGTFGSRTTPQMAPQLRQAAATLREILRREAADRWEVEDLASLDVDDGNVVHRTSGRSAGFGELADGLDQAALVDADARVTPPDEWTVAGQSLAKVTGDDMVTGRHLYTSDLRLPGMLYGRVLRPPAIEATLRSLEPSAAAALPGVFAVHDGDFAGVAAPDEPTASRALTLLRAEWAPASAQPSHRDLFESLRTGAAPGGGQGGRGQGSVDAGMAEAAERVQATFTAAYIAHVPLEPRAAVARWVDDRLTVWTGTQRPFGVREELASAFRIPEERVRVMMPDTGSAYGGKHTGEVAVEAARLARAAARPVKLVWSREEEFHWAYFRPAAAIDAAAGAGRDGRLTAWEFHTYNAGSAGIGTPYDVPNQDVQSHSSESPLRQGSYRALAATANNFARESLMDELAHVLGIDPLEIRLRNLSDPRLSAVLEAAADRFGWPGSATAGRGSGIACGFEKGGYMACCVEANVDESGEVRVTRVVTAFECGAIVHPDNLRAQVEGCVVQGLGGALFEAIEFEEGRILNGRLADYRVPRFSDVPALETVLVDRPDLPSAGAGETPIIGIAPALSGAIFQATGERRRSLPLAPNGLSA